MLQSVERLVELYRHGDFRQVFANVVPQDVPQVNVTGVRAGGGQACAPPVSEGTSRELPVQDWQKDNHSESDFAFQISQNQGGK